MLQGEHVPFYVILPLLSLPFPLLPPSLSRRIEDRLYYIMEGIARLRGGLTK